MSDAFLITVRQITALLALLSITVLAVLIVHRFIRNRREARDAARRKELRRLAVELMEYPERVIEARNRFKESDRRLLLKLFEDLRKQLKGEYAERLISLMRIMGLMTECLERLKHRDWIRRVEAAGLLGNFNDPNVILGLYRALEDSRLEVRIAAAQSLARLNAVQSVRELIQAVIPAGSQPSLAVTEIFHLLSDKHRPELRELLDHHALPPTALVLIIDALGRMGDLNAVSGMLEIYDHPSMAVRIATMQALAGLNDPRSMPAVLMSLADGAWQVRAQACRCAAKIGDPDALPVLQHLLEDGNWWVRYHAAEALTHFGLKGMMQLQAIAEEGMPDAANMAWGVLREKGAVLI